MIRPNASFDVIVVGAGPAGSTTAALLGRRGVRVLLLDRARFPRDKACGEYMSPEALGTLHRLGILERVEQLPHRKLRGIRIHAYDGSSCLGSYRPFGPYAPFRPYGLAIRRRDFDHLLLENAAALDTVTVREGFEVRELLREGGRVIGVRGASNGVRQSFSAPLVVGADGVRSVVARALGLSEFRRDHMKYAMVAYFERLPHEDYGELHMGSPGYFALAPVADDLVNINFITDRTDMKRVRGDAASFFTSELRKNPRLRQRLEHARRVSPVRVTGPLARRCTGTTAPGALLVGDSAEFVDPFTGEGLFIALRSAELAEPVIAAALDRGRFDDETLTPYAAARAAEFGDTLKSCWVIQRHLKRAWLANFVVRRLAAHPALADRVIGMSGDFVPPRAALTPTFFLRLLNPFLRAPHRSEKHEMNLR